MKKKHPTNKTLSTVDNLLFPPNLFENVHIYFDKSKLFMQFLPSCYYCLVAKLPPILLRPQYLHPFFFIVNTFLVFFFKDMIFNGCFSVLCKYSIHISAVISCVTLSKSLNLFMSQFSLLFNQSNKRIFSIELM